MKVLVIGSGGREHAIVDALTRSPQVEKIYCAPGNAGIARQAECVSIRETEVERLRDFAAEQGVGLTVVGPEVALAAGVVDCFKAAGLRIFGPTKAAARIESSKEFAKELMAKYGVPTAGFRAFTDYAGALAYVQGRPLPAVLKYDGLAAGKGVVVADTLEAAQDAVRDCFEGAFGDAGKTVLIEECMTGPECSLLAFVTNGQARCMAPAQDHKRAFDGDRGPNTGGMGVYSPVPIVRDDEMAAMVRIMEKAAAATAMRPAEAAAGVREAGSAEAVAVQETAAQEMEAQADAESDYRGVLYGGFMLTSEGPKIVEFNVRFGDPETQVVLPLLDTDLLTIMRAVEEERLSEVDVRFKGGAACCVIMASDGYPEHYEKGFAITMPAEVAAHTYVAGAKCEGEKLLTSGGRVLGVTATAADLESAVKKAYERVERVHFDNAFYRHDIGQRALKALEH